MSDEGFPFRETVQTSSVKHGIAYAIASLGAIPTRYGEPRFPSLKRRYQSDTQEKRLLHIGGDELPDIFALSSFTLLGKPQTIVPGNQAALRNSVNFTSSNGHQSRLGGAYIEAQLTGIVYSNSLDKLLDWTSSVIEYNKVKGVSEFNEGGNVYVTVEITPSFDWVDPLSKEEAAGSPLERLFAVNVSYSMQTIAARINSAPRTSKLILSLNEKDSDREINIELPDDNNEDWP